MISFVFYSIAIYWVSLTLPDADHKNFFTCLKVSLMIWALKIQSWEIFHLPSDETYKTRKIFTLNPLSTRWVWIYTLTWKNKLLTPNSLIFSKEKKKKNLIRISTGSFSFTLYYDCNSEGSENEKGMVVKGLNSDQKSGLIFNHFLWYKMSFELLFGSQ